MEIVIRQEKVSDYKETEDVVRAAFAHEEMSDQTEHELVARLRNSAAFQPQLSLVAVENKRIVGHVLLTKITIVNDQQVIDSLALAPVSVLPEFQHNGIGKLLITQSLSKAKELAYDSVIVLGHPTYYPKFGFKPASLWGIQSPFEVPDNAFMAVELTENGLRNVSGIVEYSTAFFS
ncbi:GNAT family N-acetyltransferase [Lysinibacillus sphaericus]|uniref:Putative acetyltransferase n=1 Tax=Lysinibacillus sphaericus OT4b.31 TaxID=1285586 RepID=R7ZCG4_LYSSH|nr:N-acetyltransferase [Lysinibacillus sphaericus]EON71817.1 putative acetyltransferase [Lysinibacillus sphaericus OT4b.31]